MKQVIKAENITDVVSVDHVSINKFYILHRIHDNDYAVIHDSLYNAGNFIAVSLSSNFTKCNNFGYNNVGTLHEFISWALNLGGFEIFEFDTAKEMCAFLAEKL